jgi:serine-type D-Ala-D-Ala carboxypeptidase/endopeptidase (penicillin-binding protein 4)
LTVRHHLVDDPPVNQRPVNRQFMSTRTSALPRRALAATLLVAAALSACAHKVPPATTPAAPAAAIAAPVSPRTLTSELDRIFGAAEFSRMQWGVLVQALDSGAVLYARNASKLMMPASNMKVVTLSAAAERLGWDYRYRTLLRSSAPVENGTLRGDLEVVGSGDPTINARGGSATRVFESWAGQLRAAGIARIDGQIVANASAFDRETLGAGWAWDYLAYGYAAGVSALQYNEDTASVTIRPGTEAGAPAGVVVEPLESGLLVENHVTTTAGGEVDLELGRLPGSDHLVVTGTIPQGAKEAVRSVTVDDPALYFARVLRATLVAKGIEVTGGAAHVDGPLGAAEGVPAPRVLLAHDSPPLSEIARVLMKVSQNLYAETLLRTLGMRATGTGGAREGQKVVRDVLTAWGVPPDAYVLSDGSGLSRYNYLCAETLVTVLRQMYRDPRHKEAFQATLPVGGQDGGTIARRFKGTRAEGNVRAKTGSIANVRALSGYVASLDGEPIVFSIIANSFTQPQETIDGATDRAVDLLANLTRKAR